MSNSNEQQQQKLRGPILSITHGAGPLPLEGQQDSLVKVWNQLSQSVIHPSRPDAIVIISAHYHSATPKVMIPNPDQVHAGVPNLNLFTLKFDFAGFPAHCYKYQFAPRGHVPVAMAILEEMKKNPLLADAELDTTGALDSGVWVPAMKMLPLKHQQAASLIASSHHHNNSQMNFAGSSMSRQSTTSFASQSQPNQQQHFSVSSFSSATTFGGQQNQAPAPLLPISNPSTGVHIYKRAPSTSVSSVNTTRASSSFVPPTLFGATSSHLGRTPTMSMGSSTAALSMTSSASSSSSYPQQQIVNYCDIPIVPVSVSANCDPAVQLAIGEAIRSALLKPIIVNNGNNSANALGEKVINEQQQQSTNTLGRASSMVMSGDHSFCSTTTTSHNKKSTKNNIHNNQKLPNVAIIGSGSIYHNFRKGSLASISATTTNNQQSKSSNNFNQNLKQLLSDSSLTPEERKDLMLKWRRIPGSSAYQPVPTKTTTISYNRNEVTSSENNKNGTADHFMPLLSVVAASGYQPITESLSYNYFGAPCSDFVWR